MTPRPTRPRPKSTPGTGTLVTDAATGKPQLRRIQVKVVEGPDAGLMHLLAQGSLLVGTHDDAELQLTDGRVSRRHLELQLLADGVRVHDLGSKNGVHHGAHRIESAVLAPGSRVRLGQTVLLFQPEDVDVDVGEAATFGGLTTRSPTMKQVFGLLQRIAQSDATILVEGETGVGKDVVARTLHEQSARADGPLVTVDCGAVAEHLLASELFGHKKGAFTGATHDREGLFEAASKGTLFLDEIGEMQLELQPSLLRVLENRQVRRVGESQARAIDVRIVAATNRDLQREAKEGRFREDLFYRLAVVRLRVPPLRERPEDIPDLVRLFVGQVGRSPDLVDDEAMRRLCAYPWPGNVRELKNYVSQCAALSLPDAFELLPLGSDALGAPPMTAESSTSPADPLGVSPERSTSAPQDTAQGGTEGLPYKEARAKTLAVFEEHYVRSLLEEHDGNVSAAARAAGVDRAYIYRLMSRYGIERKS